MEDTEKNLKDEIESLRRRLSEIERCGKPVSPNEACYREIFRSAMDGMFIIDLTGRYVDVNPAGCRMFGYAEEEFLSSDVRLLLFPEDVEAAFKRGEQSWRHGAFVPESRMRKKDGSEVWVELTVKPFKSNGKDLVLGIKREITSRKKAQETLLKTREELERKVVERTAELTSMNAALEEEIKRRKGVEEMLKALIEGTSSVTGEEFLRSLARHLASTLKLRYAFVGELLGENRDRVRTRVLWAGDGFAENFEYGLANSPCEKVINRGLCCYPENVSALFPEDMLLAKMGIESYIGVPLLDADKEPFGILVAMGTEPLPAEPDPCGIFRIFALRASLELRREKAEESGKKTMEMLQSIIDNSMAVIYLKDRNGKYMLVNRRYETLFNIKKEQLLGMTDYGVFPEDMADKFRENDRLVLEAGLPLKFEENALHPDGNVHTYISMKFTIPSIPGAVCGISADITERKAAEDALRASEEKLKEAQEIGHIGSWEYDIVKDKKYWSDEVFRIFGVTKEEFYAKYATYESMLKLVHPDDVELFKKTAEDAFKGKNPYSFDYRVVLSDGSVRTVHSRARVFFDKDGAPLRMSGTVQDITERKRAEERLAESEKKFRGLIESLPIGVSVTNEAGDFLEANTAICRIFGFGSKEELMKFTVPSLYVNPEDRGVSVEMIKLGAAREIEIRCKKKNGAEFLGSLTSVSQTSADGEPLFISILQDITERKKIEAELLKAQKLDSIGVLAGGIAHDFNNLLLGVLGNVSIAKNYLKPGDKAFELLDKVENAALRSKDLTKQLLTFSRGGEPLTEPSHIEQLIRDSAGLVLRGTDVSCKFLFPRGLWPVEADQGQIAQVINNIILNARQAMPGGGAVTVSAENAVVDSVTALPLKPGEYVKITVKDRGIGMTKKVLSKVFDPFFTTRKKASGLGLAISYSIIKKHRGHIAAESKAGEGSSFSIYLPSAQTASLTEGARRNSAHRGKVLVMDDEQMVRDVSGDMLELLGCTAEFAGTGEGAIELFKKAKEAGSPFDAVILDLTVPDGMGGKDALKRLLEIDPDVRAIVSSGYSKDPIMSEYHKHGFKGVITKPYTVPEFGRVINAVLADRRP
ncbi:MAG: PAS domain S-box protein [Deltaproteobacteria bacterium]|nr:PAS domain S-box protein [Deltaproteobacteria bacterium]